MFAFQNVFNISNKDIFKFLKKLSRKCPQIATSSNTKPKAKRPSPLTPSKGHRNIFAQ
jgi:hypothetical protein